jgi:hypothetical protein
VAKGEVARARRTQIKQGVVLHELAHIGFSDMGNYLRIDELAGNVYVNLSNMPEGATKAIQVIVQNEYARKILESSLRAGPLPRAVTPGGYDAGGECRPSPGHRPVAPKGGSKSRGGVFGPPGGDTGRYPQAGQRRQRCAGRIPRGAWGSIR